MNSAAATALVIAPFAYAATKLDNLLLLTALNAAGRRRRVLVRGFLLGSFAVLTLSAAGSALSLLLSPGQLGYLGLVPIALGLRWLIRPQPARPGESGRGLSLTGVASLLVANSTDTMATFAPLFAESTVAARVSLAAGFAATAIVWLGLSVWLAVPLGQALGGSRSTDRVAAVIMIVVGVYILSDTGTDTL